MKPFFNGQVIVITGASSGIGKALAYEALSQGARVAVCGRNMERLLEAFASAPVERVLCCQADVSKAADCAHFIAKVVEQWGGIDVLINNAGISMRAVFQDLDIKVLEELMGINFWGTVYTTKYALPYILERRGTIAGISSIAGYRGLPARSGYSASKFAMQGFLETLRTELLYTGVNVLWAAPGFTASNIRNTALSKDGSAQKETPLKEDKLMGAAECAQIILKGIRQRKRTIVMTTQGKLTVWMNKLFPAWMDKTVYKHFANEPGSPLKKTR